MPRIQVEQSAVVAAAAERVYGVLADYREGHARILPKPYFSDLVVEQGGYGAGTVIHVTTTVLGVARSYHMTVTEPEPGRTLAETDTSSGLVTSFRVVPTGRAQECRVTIMTSWEPQRGLAGWIERLTTPPIMRMLYRKELRQLQSYLGEQRP